MLNEEDSHLPIPGIDFKVDQVTVSRDDELSDSSSRLPTPEPRKFSEHLSGFLDGSSDSYAGSRISRSQI
jgi:hypothetical protein